MKADRRSFLTTAFLAAASAGCSGPSVHSAGHPAGQASRNLALTVMERLASGPTHQARNNMPPADAMFLSVLVRLSKARRVLEVGTSYGYASLAILSSFPSGGRLTTVDIKPERIEAAKQNVADAGLQGGVEFIEGDAHEVVTRLKGPFDLVLLNADKGNELDYLGKLHPARLAPGAVVLVHKALRWGRVMKPYLEGMARHPEFDTVTLVVAPEEGFSLAMRHG